MMFEVFGYTDSIMIFFTNIFFPARNRLFQPGSCMEDRQQEKKYNFPLEND